MDRQLSVSNTSHQVDCFGKSVGFSSFSGRCAIYSISSGYAVQKVEAFLQKQSGLYDWETGYQVMSEEIRQMVGSAERTFKKGNPFSTYIISVASRFIGLIHFELPDQAGVARMRIYTKQLKKKEKLLPLIHPVFENSLMPYISGSKKARGLDHFQLMIPEKFSLLAQTFESVGFVVDKVRSDSFFFTMNYNPW